MNFAILFLKQYWKECAAVVLIILACFFGYNAIYDRGYDAGKLLYDVHVTRIEKENAELKARKAEVVTEVQIVYRDRIQYIEKKSDSVKEEIKNGALKDEKANCSIGPNFVRLHNLSAESKPSN